MDLVLLIARLLLTAVFLVAGLAKLADRTGSRRALVEFGIPSALATPLGVLLPIAELAVAAALIPAATAQWGALGALGLLLVFISGIGINLARGRRPDCHCFGQLHSAPIGWPTLTRNLALGAVAGIVFWQAGEARPMIFATAPIAFDGVALVVGVIALGLVLIQGWFLFQLLGQNGRMLIRMQALEAGLGSPELAATASSASAAAPGAGLPVGMQAPPFSLAALDGGVVTLDMLREAGKPLVLIFSDAGCASCMQIMPEIGRWQRDLTAKLRIAVITRGPLDNNRAKAAEHGVTNVLLQQDREVAGAYRAAWTPSAVMVRGDGTVGSPTAVGPEMIRSLVGGLESGRAVATPRSLAAPGVTPVATGRSSGALQPPQRLAAASPGTPAPPVKVADLSGRTVKLSELRSRTLILFWNPDCHYCQDALELLRAWESEPPDGAPKLLIVSTGSVEANKAMGLRSRIVLDPSLTTAAAFGAPGTPSAVLLDAKGLIASHVVAGASAVFGLANGRLDQVPLAPRAFAGLPAGTKAPDFTLRDLNGSERRLQDFVGRPRVLVFFSPRCGYCARMAPRLGMLPDDALPLLLISRGDPDEHRRLAEEHGWRCDVLLDPNWEVANAYRSTGTPTGYLLDADGSIASELAVGADALLGLAARGSNLRGDAGLRPGTQAPGFRLADLEGRERSLAEFRGKRVLLVLSDPGGCISCDRLAPRLVELYKRHHADNLEVVMVSRGDAQSNLEKARHHGFRFPVLLEEGWQLRKDYAVFATPAGYLIDERGVIAREVAIGNDAIARLVEQPVLR